MSIDTATTAALVAMVTAGHALATGGTLDVPPQFADDPRRPFARIAVNQAGERVLEAMRQHAAPLTTQQDWERAVTLVGLAIDNGLAPTLAAHGLDGG